MGLERALRVCGVSRGGQRDNVILRGFILVASCYIFVFQRRDVPVGTRLIRVLMIRMLIIGYVFGLRSEGLLCREVRGNFAYCWFCKLGIEHKILDDSVFSRARNERFRKSGIFRQAFECVVDVCIAADLVGGEGFAVDAGLTQADATSNARSRAQNSKRHAIPRRPTFVRW
jgi:transposase